jgi:nitrile hydratase subunit beta
MNGVHDMGGLHGFGPVIREENEPRFHADWEAHVVAMADLTESYYTIDEFRHGIERMQPVHYLHSSYFERWLATIELNLVEKGYLSEGEVDTRMDLLRRQPDVERPTPGSAAVKRAHEQQAASPDRRPRFAVGDVIVTRNDHPAGHTRLPRYARGKRGVIHQLHGAQVFPDSNAHGRGEDPHVLYNVRFDGRELWGDDADGTLTVYLDLWEPYLEPAPPRSQPGRI